MKKHKVDVATNAKQDLLDIFQYVNKYDGYVNAKKLLAVLSKKIKSLCSSPARGNYVPELLTLGLKLFREVHFGPYRIIYQVTTKQVVVMAIIDGRRDLSSLLEARLLRRDI